MYRIYRQFVAVGGWGVEGGMLNWVEDHILTRFRTHKIASPPQTLKLQLKTTLRDCAFKAQGYRTQDNLFFCCPQSPQLLISFSSYSKSHASKSGPRQCSVILYCFLILHYKKEPPQLYMHILTFHALFFRYLNSNLYIFYYA